MDFPDRGHWYNKEFTRITPDGAFLRSYWLFCCCRSSVVLTSHCIFLFWWKHWIRMVLQFFQECIIHILLINNIHGILTKLSSPNTNMRLTAEIPFFVILRIFIHESIKTRSHSSLSYEPCPTHILIPVHDTYITNPKLWWKLIGEKHFTRHLNLVYSTLTILDRRAK